MQKAELSHLQCAYVRAQELCEGRGGRTEFPVPNSPYALCGRKATRNRVYLQFHPAVTATPSNCRIVTAAVFSSYCLFT